MKHWLLVFALLNLFACDDEPIAFFSLGEFRVLALKADHPEIDGSATTDTAVSITPYISDVYAGGRMISLKILACVDPGIGLGNVPVCDQSLPSTQAIAYSDVHTQTLGARYSGYLPSFTVNVPPNLLAGLSDQIRYNGLDYLITVEFRAGNDVINTYKRINVSERVSQDKNPLIKNVLVNLDAGASVTDLAKLSLTVESGFDPETYDVLDQDGNFNSKTEVYSVSWFSFQGTTDLSRTYLDESAEFKANLEADDPFVIAVLRDGRGGIDVQLKE